MYGFKPNYKESTRFGIRNGDAKIMTMYCPECESKSNIGVIFSCIQCDSQDIERSDLTEHYSCGFVGPIGNDNVCPKCRQSIGEVGVDYRLFHDYYVCSDCGDKFPKPKMRLNCNFCETKFSLEKANWSPQRERHEDLIYQ